MKQILTQMHCSSLETIDWHVTHTTINTGWETTHVCGCRTH